ncbi:hypothetical protein FACS1894178_4700 [Bacteroidia bacterium]|nr:hypothetical protein FACS1894178_4700 [Bacteroidia bacterium]
MKKITLFLFAGIIAIAANSQTKSKTNQNLMWDGVQRQYIEIVPSDNSVAKPVLFCLHGIGGNMQEFGNIIPENAPDWFYIVPEALNYTAQLYGNDINMGNAWNVGATASVMGFQFPINSTVDDAGFLMAILDSLEHHFNIATDSVFFCGFSLGAFMSNRMAIEHSDRIAAIASVSGTKGNDMLSATPVGNISVLQIHGTADPVVDYASGNANLSGVPVLGTVNTPFGIGAEANVEYWKSFNNCATEAIVYDYPTNIANRTCKRYVYPDGDNGSRVAFIQVENGTHSWYASEAQQGIHYFNEIIKFFRNQWEEAPSSNPFSEQNSKENVTIFPNPASTYLCVNTENNNAVLEIFNSLGEKVLETKLNNFNNNIDISRIKSGRYIVRVNNYVQSIIVR